MRDTKRWYWLLFPVLASLTTQCGEESPRGVVPTSIVEVEIVLTSMPAGEPANQEEFQNCLARLGDVGNHVRPSWRNQSTPVFNPEHVPLVRTSPNTFVATFQDVPSNTQNTLTVHDENECRRNPVILGVAGQPGRLADGRVTEGVTANGIPITTVVGNDALLLTVRADGTIVQ